VTADVILADRDEAMLGVLARQLLGEGIPVRTAGTGEAAIGLAREKAPGLLVLDPGLQDPGGFAVVEALRREPGLAELPLLVYSGRDLDPAERERLRLGPTRFLTKSRASDDEFRSSVRELLGAPGRSA
jgi:CheY-like chemotaxis protein